MQILLRTMMTAFLILPLAFCDHERTPSNHPNLKEVSYQETPMRIYVSVGASREATFSAIISSQEEWNTGKAVYGASSDKTQYFFAALNNAEDDITQDFPGVDGAVGFTVHVFDQTGQEIASHLFDGLGTAESIWILESSDPQNLGIPNWRTLKRLIWTVTYVLNGEEVYTKLPPINWDISKNG